MTKYQDGHTLSRNLGKLKSLFILTFMLNVTIRALKCSNKFPLDLFMGNLKQVTSWMRLTTVVSNFTYKTLANNGHRKILLLV